jgi:Domain of unknown function (DUF4384)
MKTTRQFTGAMSICVAIAALTACVQIAPIQQPAAQFERGTLLTKVDSVLAASQPGGGLKLTVNPNTLATGQTLQVDVMATQPGYIYIYQVSTDGRTLSLVFPNAIDGANYLPNGMLQLPRGNWQLKARGPAGTGYLLAVQTPQSLDALMVQSDANGGNIYLPKSYNAALATLREVSQ